MRKPRGQPKESSGASTWRFIPALVCCIVGIHLVVCLVRRVNHDLCRFTPDGSFVALVTGVYDVANNSFTYINCGHSPEPFYLPSDASKPVTYLSQLGSMILGVQEDIEIQETLQQLALGDAILLATDGLTEAMDSQNELYGKDRLINRLKNHRWEPMEEIVTSLIADVCGFSAGSEQSDDQTVLAFLVRCAPLKPNIQESGQTK